MSLLACLLSFMAVACLALSMPKHFNAIFSSTPDTRVLIALRAIGWLLLAASFIPCMAAWGISIGIVAGLGLLAAAVPAVVMLITYGPWIRAKL
jgi:hypothetical protein